MEKVTVQRAKLIGIIERNRVRHEDIYEKAMAGYKKKRIAATRKVIGMYQRDLKTMIAGKLPPSTRAHTGPLHLNVPRKFTDEYVRALGMLRMHTEDTITLTAAEFDQFVRDQWGWSKDFVASNSIYTKSAKARI